MGYDEPRSVWTRALTVESVSQCNELGPRRAALWRARPPTSKAARAHILVQRRGTVSVMS
jgi:hypothetical protein